MSEPIDYAWGMLKQQDGGGFNVVQQAAPGLQFSLPMGGGEKRKKGPGLFSRLRKPKSEHLATMEQQAQQAAQKKYPLRGDDPVQQTPPPLPGRGRNALGAALSGGKLLGQLGAAALSAADAQQSGSLMGTLGAAQSGYLQAGAALSPLDRFSQRTQDMYGARQDYETEQAMAAQQAQQQTELDEEAKTLAEEGAQEPGPVNVGGGQVGGQTPTPTTAPTTAPTTTPTTTPALSPPPASPSGPPVPAMGQPNPQEKAAEEAQKQALLIQQQQAQQEQQEQQKKNNAAQQEFLNNQFDLTTGKFTGGNQ